MKYTFGTSPTAADRLERIAGFFNRHSLQFVGRCVRRSVASLVDLGCGPGFTTEMLRQALAADTVSGLDRSGEFLALAAERFGGCRFIRHDVTELPLPVPAELLYSRFLLTHLGQPRRLVRRWLEHLDPAGMLLIEEVEAIDTRVPAFRRYLELAEGLIGSAGGSLYVGRELAADSYDAQTVQSAPKSITVTNAEAASWFYPNAVSVWEENEFIRSATTPVERYELAAELGRIWDSGTREQGIRWTMRQMALVRR